MRVVDDWDPPTPMEPTAGKGAPDNRSTEKRNELAAEIESVNSGAKQKINAKLEGKSKSK